MAFLSIVPDFRTSPETADPCPSSVLEDHRETSAVHSAIANSLFLAVLIIDGFPFLNQRHTDLHDHILTTPSF